MKARHDFKYEEDYNTYIRTYISAIAMQGMIAGLTRFRTDVNMEDIIINRPNDIAEISCTYADALIAALNK